MTIFFGYILEFLSVAFGMYFATLTQHRVGFIATRMLRGEIH